MQLTMGTILHNRDSHLSVQICCCTITFVKQYVLKLALLKLNNGTINQSDHKKRRQRDSLYPVSQQEIVKKEDCLARTACPCPKKIIPHAMTVRSCSKSNTAMRHRPTTAHKIRPPWDHSSAHRSCPKSNTTMQLQLALTKKSRLTCYYYLSLSKKTILPCGLNDIIEIRN